MKKILLFIMLMFAVNVLLFNSTSTDLWAKKQAKEQKVEKQKKAVKKETKAAREEKAAKKEAKEARAEKASKREAKEARAEKAAKREVKESKRETKADREERTQQFRGSDGRTYHLGPRGGCYYMNANGNKSYVDRDLCK